MGCNCDCLCILGHSGMHRLHIVLLLYRCCWMAAAAGGRGVICQGSYNLITSAHKLRLSCGSSTIWCQSWTGTHAKAKCRALMDQLQIDGCLCSKIMLVRVCVWAGADITRSLIRLDEIQALFNCGCSHHHHHHHLPLLQNRCTARQMWLNLAVGILHSPSAQAIRGSRASKPDLSH